MNFNHAPGYQAGAFGREEVGPLRIPAIVFKGFGSRPCSFDRVGAHSRTLVSQQRATLRFPRL